MHQGDGPRAKTVLLSQGYWLPIHLTEAQEAAYLRSQCEYHPVREDGLVCVELHWDITRRHSRSRVDELRRCLAARHGWQEWGDIRRDLAALAEVEVRDGAHWYLLRTALQGVAGKVLQAVGMAIPPPVRPLPDVVPSPAARPISH